MSPISGESYQSDLLRYYLTALDYQGDTEVMDFALGLGEPAKEATIRVVRMSLPIEQSSGLWFVGSLGAAGTLYEAVSGHEHQFVGLYDSADRALLELVASVYHYHRFAERLDYGHTVPLGQGGVRRLGYSGALILHSGVCKPLREEQIQVAGIPTRLLSVVPITQAELELKRDHGLDMLFDSWDRADKDILHVGSGV
jgi:hypothetical protein